jgi:hypothetical protein
MRAGGEANHRSGFFRRSKPSDNSRLRLQSPGMTREQLQEQCELGQRQLMAMEYLEAIETLAAAEVVAWANRDYDTLARLYMPLQEARRQARQRCGEGTVRLDVIANGPSDAIDLDHLPIHGQMLVAGWASIQPALRLRAKAREQKQYVETFLAAVFPITRSNEPAIVIAPLEDVALPDAQPRSIDALLASLPAHCLVFGPNELPRGARHGTTETYGEVMAMWERLHLPYLGAADLEVDPERRMEGYRKTIRVDPACELAHQKLSDVAKDLKRTRPMR